MSGAKLFDRLLEKATSPLLLEVDWEGILKICDLIRQGDVQAKYVVNQIKKKLTNENIHVLNFSLQCIESIVKNCGSKVHQEIATKDFMDLMRNIAGSKPDPVKTKVLELIQCWSHAFRKIPNYKIVEDYFNAMKLEGFTYPALKEAEAMFDVEEAPAWKDDSECSNCFRCRAEFTALRRRHHCRACGQIFCNACSAKQATIPKYGIEKEVRVCDVCYDKINRVTTSQPSSSSSPNDELPAEYLNSQLFKEAKATATKPKSEKTDQEFEEEIQLALALSQSEIEADEANKKKKSSSFLSTSKSSSGQSKTLSNSNTEKQSNKSKSNSERGFPQVSNASAPYEENVTSNITGKNGPVKAQVNDDSANTYNQQEILINKEIDEFVEEVKKILELYINRMKSDSIRGRSITNDTAVQSLFLQLQHLHPKLLSYIKYQEDARAYYENLQDKLTQLKDAREALNALRHENFEKKKRDLEERERIRQVQIAQKLQLMRQQKQNYYLYQNQLNLQRLQEQEKELQLRLNQQRELVLQRDQQFFPNSNGLANFKPNEPMGNINNYNNDLQQNPLNYNPQMMPQMAGANFMNNQSFSSLNNPSLTNINNMTSLPPNPYNNIPPPNLDKQTFENQLQQTYQIQQQNSQFQMPQIQAQNINQPQAQQFQHHIPQQQPPPQPNYQYQQYQNSQINSQPQQQLQQNGYQIDPTQYNQMAPIVNGHNVENNITKEAQLISFD